MAKDDTIYLQHVLDAVNTVQEYLRGVNEEKFKVTRLLQDGVIRQIEIIGEFGVDIEKVWDTAQQDLPVLKEQVIGILKDYGRGNS